MVAVVGEQVRTEVEVAADAVAALFAHGVLRVSPEMVERASRAAGVAPTEVRDAWRRFQDGRYRPPARAATGPGLPEPRPEAARSLPHPGQIRGAHRGGRVSAEKRIAEKNPAPGVRVCRECGPRPTDQFRKKGVSRSGAQVLDYLCIDCRRRYFRDRYVKVGEVAIRVELLEGDEMVGRDCPECGRAVAAGDVVVVGSPRHDVCPDVPR